MGAKETPDLINERIESDLKAAMLAGDKEKTETLRNVKSALLYEAVNKRLSQQGLSDDLAQSVLAREAKKRQEAADIYSKAGADDKAAKELSEKSIIQKYLPAQLSEEELSKIIDEEIAKLESPTVKEMGGVIGAVKSRVGNQADGGTLARLVKEALEPTK